MSHGEMRRPTTLIVLRMLLRNGISRLLFIQFHVNYSTRVVVFTYQPCLCVLLSLNCNPYPRKSLRRTSSLGVAPRLSKSFNPLHHFKVAF